MTIMTSNAQWGDDTTGGSLGNVNCKDRPKTFPYEQAESYMDAARAHLRAWIKYDTQASHNSISVAVLKKEQWTILDTLHHITRQPVATSRNYKFSLDCWRHWIFSDKYKFSEAPEFTHIIHYHLWNGQPLTLRIHSSINNFNIIWLKGNYEFPTLTLLKNWMLFKSFFSHLGKVDSNKKRQVRSCPLTTANVLSPHHSVI